MIVQKWESMLKDKMTNPESIIQISIEEIKEFYLEELSQSVISEQHEQAARKYNKLSHAEKRDLGLTYEEFIITEKPQLAFIYSDRNTIREHIKKERQRG